ncbi:OmpA family protein [candidate division GN15 bacterium]|nr:OmpA family protein [candidate division GN15 bacterium]
MASQNNSSLTAGLSALSTGCASATGGRAQFQHRLVPVQILEMEDVLFHLNSAVMMPDRPAGRSSEDGAQPSDEQSDMTGLNVLALVFRQFEFDPTLRMIVTGHTDTSGGTRMNFELSQQRAKGVLYLLNGDIQQWQRLCFQRHKVEDYQQIIEYFHNLAAPWKRSNWNCDPQGLDNKFGNKTRNAINGFAQGYNRDYADAYFTPRLPDNLGDIIANRPNHTWPESDWRAIYHLYSQVICDTLQILPLELDNQRENALRYVDDDKPIVGCGESFPLDERGRDNYRSQQNRRVEILFFADRDAPPMTCPAVTDRTHTEAECPLWSRYHFEPTYISPGDLHAVAYHLKFEYYNKVRDEVMAIPPGLNIEALRPDDTAINSRVVQGSDLYTVVVQFATQDEADNLSDKVRFRFAAPDSYIFTANSSDTPRIVTRTAEEIDALSDLDRWRHYDLPTEWESTNWFATKDDDVEPISELLKQSTSASSPIVFDLDSIVLVDGTGSQAIRDRSAFVNGANPNGVPKPLSEHSRVRILFVDPEDHQMKIFPEVDPTSGDIPADHEETLIRFEQDENNVTRNFIVDTPENARAVVFCGDFYDVTRKRTVRNGSFNPAAGHVLGARAAVLNDDDVHGRQTITYRDGIDTVHNSGIGDFDLHYLHDSSCDGSRFYSHLIVYWSCFIIKDPDPTVGGTGGERPATDAEVEEFFSVGMVNSMFHWNKKLYEFERTDGNRDRIVRPFFMFEGNETLDYTPSSAFDFEDDNFKAMWTRADFNAALRNTHGGRPKSVAVIVEEDKGSWVVSARAADRPFSLLSLRIKTREDDPGRFSGFPFDEFEDPEGYGCLVMAHELGHATGQVDDYMDKVPNVRTNGRLPNFGQFGVTSGGNDIRDNNSNFPQRVQGSESWDIDHDKLTMMDKNGPIRMRHVWRFVHWLNEQSKSGGSLHRYLEGDQFRMYYPRADMHYHRQTADPVDPWRWSNGGQVTISGNKTANLYLFQELDETRRLDRSVTDNPTDFRAILNVRFLLSIAFVDNGAHTWSGAQKRAWARMIYNWLTKSTGPYKVTGRFQLTGGGGALDPTIIRVIPGFEIYSPGSPPGHGAFNYRVEVKQSSNDPFNLNNQRRLRLGDNHSARKIINYFYDKPEDAAALSAADFNFVATWFNQPSVSSGGFRVEEV